jgi:hypothetical protein
VRNEFKPSYLKAGAVAHSMHRFPDMMRQLTRYDWGLCGHLDSHPQWQKAMPNKLFEYLAAGIPVISINSDEVSGFVVEHGVGTVTPTLSGLADAARNKDLQAMCAGFVAENRHKFVMESQVPEIEALYAEAAAYRQDRHGPWVQVPVVPTGIEACGKWVCFEQPEGAPQDNLGGDQLQPELSSPDGNDQKAVQGELYP